MPEKSPIEGRDLAARSPRPARPSTPGCASAWPGISIRPRARPSGSTSPRKLGWDPRREIRGFADLAKLGPFQDEWLRGGPVRRWVPKAYADRPIYVFETGGSTGIPKSRINIEDFRIDYSMFSETLDDEVLSPRRQLADARSFRAAAAAAGRRAPGPGPRRHLLLHRSRSPLGHPPDQAGAVRRGGGLQGSRASSRP